MNDRAPASKTKSDVICIIGMHRSGTSMIARLLSLCGLYLGPDDQMFGPNDGNPDGHFEHTGFLRLDEALLNHFGGSWEFPPKLNHDWQNDLTLARFVLEAKSLVRSFPTDSPWGWKEPRTTLLLPFWKSIVPNLRFVICVRNPIDVAKSLAKRNGMTIEHGVYLWNRYMRDALQGTAGYPIEFTFYDDFFVEAPAEIQRIARFCGLPVPEEFSRFQDVISGDLRHHASSDQEVLSGPVIATEYKMFYVMLRSLLRRELGDMDRDSIIHGDVSEFLRLADEFRNQEKAAHLEAVLDAKNVELNEVQFKLDESARHIRQLQEQMTHIQQHAERLQTFSDAVRQTLVYRLYKTCIKPLVSLRARS